MRARISPVRRRSTASGLIRMSERSTAIERTSLLGASPPPRGADFKGRNVDCGRLDGGLAVRTHLPERLERRLAVDAGLLQLRRADGTDQEFVGDLRATDRAVEVAAREPLLHRLDLELALTHVLEVLRRAEQHVDERAEVRQN